MMPRGLAVAADRLADARARCPNRCRCRRRLRRQPDILVPQCRRCLRGCRRRSFRKQEIGRPRPVPPFDSTGVAGMNHSLRDVVVDALRVRRRRRHRPRRRARTGPGSSRPAADSGRAACPCRNRSAARRASGRYGPGGDLASGLRRARRSPPGGPAPKSLPLARDRRQSTCGTALQSAPQHTGIIPCHSVLFDNRRTRPELESPNRPRCSLTTHR